MTKPVLILVVDDEPDLELLIRRHFRDQIREQRYTFHFVRNGPDALARLRDKSDVSLVLCDLNMPDMDGLELLRKIEVLADPAPARIVVSAYSDMGNIRAAMNHGAFDFITKPIDLDDLAATIDLALRKNTTGRP